jgi:hypothetical protein
VLTKFETDAERGLVGPFFISRFSRFMLRGAAERQREALKTVALVSVLFHPPKRPLRWDNRIWRNAIHFLVIAVVRTDPFNLSAP